MKENDISVNGQRRFVSGMIKLFYSSLFFISFSTAVGQNVIMQHNDLKRTGWDAGETILTQANVSGGTFGKIFQVNVDDQIYSQPLIVNNVLIGGQLRNIVIITTVNNSVYAYDADDPAKASTPYWHVNLTYPTYRPVQNTDMWDGPGNGGACTLKTDVSSNYYDITGKMGIIGTPAIDVSGNGTIYVVAKSIGGVVAGQPGKLGNYVQQLHALNLIDGTDKVTPVSISASLTSNGNTTNFDSRLNNQRPALLLLNGVVYIGWASYCDFGDYHGWLIGYDAGTLAQKYVYNVTPEGTYGGIWMSGQGPSVDDADNIYISTGNGSTGKSDGSNPDYPLNRGESVVKLNPSLTMVDYFTPYNYDFLTQKDYDYGVDGVLLIPNTNLSLSGSKEGWLYLVNINSMGHTVVSDAVVPQLLDVNAAYAGEDKHIHGSPVYYKDDKSKEYIYAWAEDGLLKQFPFIRSTSLFDVNNIILGNTVLPYGMPGAMMSVTSNGAAAGTGILWASHPVDPSNGNANTKNVLGIVQAFDATNVSHELWNSNLNSLRDSLGTFGKFVPPTIANGKLYMATFSNNLKVYGLNAPVVTSCILPATKVPNPWTSGDIGFMPQPGDACYTTPNNGTYTVTSEGQDAINNQDAFHSVFQPVAGNQMEIIAHIVSLDNTIAGAKAGIMFRSNLDPGSPNVFMALNPFTNGTYAWSSRTSQNVLANGVNGTTTGHWLKLSALGNVFTAYTSPTGAINSWTQAGTITLNLGTNIYGGLAYTTTNNSSGTAVFDNVSVTFSGTLPVTLIDFTGSNVNNEYSQLNWVTSAETDFDYFDIEHSAANTNFISVGTVPGHGNSQVDQHYNFTDNNPADGDNYYRLKMVDKDGKVAYSKVIKIPFNLSKMSLFPNPASDKVYLKNNLHFTSSEQITVELISPMGQRLFIQDLNTNGQDLLTVNFPAGIMPGVYYIRATNSKGVKQNWKIMVKN